MRTAGSSRPEFTLMILTHRVAQPAGRPQLAGGDQPKASRAAAILLGGACGRRGAASVRAELAPRAQALESPASNFTRSPRRLIVEWHAEAHLLPPWERTVEARADPPVLGARLRSDVRVGRRLSRGCGVQRDGGSALSCS